MLNLIAITTCTSARHIENLLTSLLDIKIDLITDVDQGLQEVLAKRPTILCLESDIAGISAENFAQHVDRLLGAEAPAFVLFHLGSTARAAGGLFGYQLDLSWPQAKLEATAQAAFESILGGRWEQARTVQAQQDPVVEPTIDLALFEIADTLDEFMVNIQAELGKEQGFSSLAPSDPALAEVPPVQERQEKFDAPPLPLELPTPRPQPARRFAKRSSVCFKVRAPLKTKVGAPQGALPSSVPLITSSTPAPGLERPATAPCGEPPVIPASIPLSAGDFLIDTVNAASTEATLDQLPFLVEDVRVPNRSWMRVGGISLGILVFMAAGTWYVNLYGRKLDTLWRCAVSSRSVRKAPVSAPPPVAAVSPKPVAKAPAPPTAASAGVLTFIPKGAPDSAYSDKHPGWERYVGSAYECRIFKEQQRIRAVQVLGLKQQPIDKELLGKVLLELVGSSAYHETSTSRKGGFSIMRGSVDNKADLMTYSKKSKLYALVVSLS